MGIGKLARYHHVLLGFEDKHWCYLDIGWLYADEKIWPDQTIVTGAVFRHYINHDLFHGSVWSLVPAGCHNN